MSQDDEVMGDDMDVTQTNESGVQADLRPETSSSGYQADLRPETRSIGAQSASTRMAESETQTKPKPKTKNREAQTTEDRTDEIARLQAIHEQQQQALIASHQSNIESVRNQLRANDRRSRSKT